MPLYTFAGRYGDNGFLEDYTSQVRGEPIGSVVTVTRDAAGQTARIVVNHRPLSALLLLFRLMGEHFAGTPYGKLYAGPERVNPYTAWLSATRLLSDQ